MRLITILFFACLMQNVSAQIDTLEFDDPIVDSLKNRLEHIQCTMDYPDSLKIEDTTIVVIVSFLMHPDGSFSDLNIEKGENRLVNQYVIGFLNKTIRLQAFDILGEKYFIWYAVPVIVTLK